MNEFEEEVCQIREFHSDDEVEAKVGSFISDLGSQPEIQCFTESSRCGIPKPWWPWVCFPRRNIFINRRIRRKLWKSRITEVVTFLSKR
jgi:hypothetical protein